MSAKGRPSHLLRGWLLFFGIALVLLAIFLFTCRIYTAAGLSMAPTLSDGDIFLCQQVGYPGPKQGDILLIQSPRLPGLIIKRVIAVGGQQVRVDYNSDTVFVDAHPIEEPYRSSEPMVPTGSASPSEALLEITVPQGFVYVLGDNRNHSVDSRDPRLGLVEEETILGRVIWPR